MDLDRDARIAPTAHYTAHVWHRLGLPHAELFATGRGRRLFWTFRFAGEWIAFVLPGVPNMQQYLEMRHRAIDWALGEYAPDCVVEIGAGLSRRGLTFVADHDAKYVEVDLPHMVEAKQRAIKARASRELRLIAAARLRQEAVDVLSAEFREFLTKELQQGERRAVVAEGLLGYFAIDERTQIVKNVAGALADAGGGIFLCDLRAAEGGASVAFAAKVLRAAIRIVTRGRGARRDFRDADAVRAFFAECGFSKAEPIGVERATPNLARLKGPGRVWQASV